MPPRAPRHHAGGGSPDPIDVAPVRSGAGARHHGGRPALPRPATSPVRRPRMGHSAPCLDLPGQRAPYLEPAARAGASDVRCARTGPRMPSAGAGLGSLWPGVQQWLRLVARTPSQTRVLPVDANSARVRPQQRRRVTVRCCHALGRQRSGLRRGTFCAHPDRTCRGAACSSLRAAALMGAAGPHASSGATTAPSRGIPAS